MYTLGIFVVVVVSILTIFPVTLLCCIFQHNVRTNVCTYVRTYTRYVSHKHTLVHFSSLRRSICECECYRLTTIVLRMADKIQYNNKIINKYIQKIVLIQYSGFCCINSGYTIKSKIKGFSRNGDCFKYRK